MESQAAEAQVAHSSCLLCDRSYNTILIPEFYPNPVQPLLQGLAVRYINSMQSSSSFLNMSIHSLTVKTVGFKHLHELKAPNPIQTVKATIEQSLHLQR